jgi:hypothetical protein
LNRRADQRFFLPPLGLGFLPLLLVFEDFFGLLFDLDGSALREVAFVFELLVDLPFLDGAFAFEVFPPAFFAGRLAPPAAFPLFFEDFELAPFDVALTFAATAFTAFFAAGAVADRPAARPANAPITPPTTAPTGPATLPRTAPVAAPAVCFDMGGISMFSDDEPEVSVDP